MVCMAVLLYNACTDSAGKIMAIWFPVVVFVISGYEHCVANSELFLSFCAPLSLLINISFSSVLHLSGSAIRCSFDNWETLVQPVRGGVREHGGRSGRYWDDVASYE